MINAIELPLVKNADAIRKAGIGPAKAEAAVAKATKELQDSEVRIRESQSEYDRIVNQLQNAALDQILSGQTSLDVDEKLSKESQRLKAEHTARLEAKPILEKRLAQAKAAFEAAQSTRPAIILPAISESKKDTLDQLRSKIAETLPLAAALIAHQSVQDNLLGTKFKLPRNLCGEEFNPVMLVEALYAYMPPRLRPDEQQIKEMHAVAEQIADSTIQQLKEKS